MGKTTKLISVNLQEQILEKLDQLQERYGATNRTNAISMTIALAHKREFPEYIQMKKESNARTPEDMARAKLAVEEAKEQAQEERERARQEGICLLMDGAEIVSDPTTGRPACRYTMYTMSSPHIVDETPMITALSLMNDDTPHLQYNDWMGRTGDPAKHTIREAIKKMKERKEKTTMKLPKSKKAE